LIAWVVGGSPHWRAMVEGQKLSRKVTWAEVEGACAEMIKYEYIKPAVILGDGRCKDESQMGEERNKKNQLGCICGIVQTCCMTPAHQPRAAKKGGKKMHGYLWKLNAECVDDPDALADIHSWRRRLFFLNSHPKERVLTYISEKENGTAVLAAVLSGSAHAKIRELPSLEFKDLPEQDRAWVATNIQQYHIAFSGEPILPTEDAMEQVPSTLCAFCIEYSDKSKVNHRLFLASALESSRSTWLRALRRRSENL